MLCAVSGTLCSIFSDLLTCADADSVATDREMDTEVEEKYSVDDDLSMLGPDAGRWWNYSEKGTGDDYSLEDIKDDNTYREDAITSVRDESVVENNDLFIEKLPTNFWKPLIPSGDLVSVTPGPFSLLPSNDITHHNLIGTTPSLMTG